MIVREHVSCLFRSPPIDRCGDIAAPVPMVDPAMWPMVVMGIMILGLVLAIWFAPLHRDGMSKK